MTAPEMPANAVSMEGWRRVEDGDLAVWRQLPPGVLNQARGAERLDRREDVGVVVQLLAVRAEVEPAHAVDRDRAPDGGAARRRDHVAGRGARRARLVGVVHRVHEAAEGVVAAQLD